jgi:predicted SnoaL-like aldol condensation-catalyzing enzyme
MNRLKPAGNSLAAVAFVFTSLLCCSLMQARTALAAGAVEMQVARIVNSAVDGYNGAMETGEQEKWLKYFTDNVNRQGPLSQQQGKQAFAEYYGREFETYQAKWTTKNMVISGRSGAVEFEWDAVHKASGEPLMLNMVAVFQLASSGKFESVKFYFDTAKLGEHTVAAGGSSEK